MGALKDWIELARLAVFIAFIGGFMAPCEFIFQGWKIPGSFWNYLLLCIIAGSIQAIVVGLITVVPLQLFEFYSYPEKRNS